MSVQLEVEREGVTGAGGKDRIAKGLAARENSLFSGCEAEANESLFRSWR